MLLFYFPDFVLNFGVIITLDIVFHDCLNIRVHANEFKPSFLTDEVAFTISFASINEDRSGIKSAVIASENAFVRISEHKSSLLVDFVPDVDISFGNKDDLTDLL